MKIEIKDGKLCIDVAEFVESLSESDKRAVAKSLCAQQVLHAAVLECVVTGNFYDADDDGGWWFDSDAVLKLREQLMPLMPEIARKAVETALNQRNMAMAGETRYRDWAFAMYHARQDGEPDPRWPDWAPSPHPTEAEVDAVMAGGES